jgi:hypothetical protein
MGKAQLVSSERQRTCTSIVGGEKVPRRAQCEGYGASAIFSGLVTTQFLLLSVIKSCSERAMIRER